MVGVLIIGACEGQNLFEPIPPVTGTDTTDTSTTNPGDTTDTGTPTPTEFVPPTVTIQMPTAGEQRRIGDSILVEVRVSDNAGVSTVGFITGAIRGDPDLGTDTFVVRHFEKTVALNSAPLDTTIMRYLLATPDSTEETVQVVVLAQDPSGNLGGAAVDLDLIRGDRVAPTVTIQVPAASPLESRAIGDSLFVMVQLQDNEGVDSVRFSATATRGDASLGTDFTVERFGEKTITFGDGVLDTTVTRYLLPTADSTREVIQLVVEAHDTTGNFLADTVDVLLAPASEVIDGTPPVVTIQAPTPSPVEARALGDSVLVTARLTDNFGVDSVTFRGVTLRGDPALGNDVEHARFDEKGVALPGATDTTVSRWLLPTDDRVEETTTIIVTAYDTTGNVSADTIDLQLGGPTVEDRVSPTVTIQAPVAAAARAVGDSVLVTARIQDNVSAKTVRFFGTADRGDPALGSDEVVQRYFEKTAELAAGATDTTVSRWLNATNDDVKETVHIVVEATDSTGNVAVDTVDISITGPNVDFIDVAGGQTTFEAGLTLPIRFSAFDQLGVDSIRLEFTGAFADTVQQTIAPVQDTVVFDSTFAIPPAIRGDVEFRAFAWNTLGVRATSATLTYEVTDAIDRQAPTVTIQVPVADSLAKPVGDSVLVEARIQDDISLRTVRFFGTAFRGDPDLGTDTTVLRFNGKQFNVRDGLRDTTVMRFLLPTADSLREAVDLIVEATDSTGNVAADTIVLIVGGPDVQFVDLVNGQTVAAASVLNVRVSARDPLGIVRVNLAADSLLSFDSLRTISSIADTTVTFELTLPATAGTLALTGTARNDLGVESQVGPIFMSVVTGGPGDTIRPSVRQIVGAPERMEQQENLLIEVEARDDTQGGGLRAVGYTILGIEADTVIAKDSVVYGTPRTGLVAESFQLLPFNFDPLALPVDMVYEITAWAIDAAENCGAARGSDSLAANVCAPLGRALTPADTLTTQDTIQVQDRSGERLAPTIVAGRTVSIPGGGQIMDAVVDTVPTPKQGIRSRRLYLSNLDRDRIEVFDLDNEVFDPPIPVGSEPWGLTMNHCFPADPSPEAFCGDTLIVANSGGTNISMVDLDAGAEIPTSRLLTPDVVLFEIGVSLDGTGIRRYSGHFIPGGFGFQFSFSDRPQFIARDSTENLLYSTKTVPFDPVELGTIRRAFSPGGAGGRPEVQIFIQHGFPMIDNPDFFTIANVDSLDLFSVATGDEVVFHDHIPGTTTLIASIQDEATVAAGDAIANGSDIFIGTGRFDLDEIGFKDTTFVAASGDGGWIVIGEGDTEADDEVARIIMYNAASQDVSRNIPVWDRMLNDGEIVRGIGLNFDGTFGAARGRNAYFFTQDLRLQGVADIEVPGGAGAVLHPLHADARRLDQLGQLDGDYYPDTHIAFIPTGENTIDIYDTFHFFRSGRIFIRDTVIGPLKAALPFPADNGGLTCPLVAVMDGAGNAVGQVVDIFDGNDFSNPYAPDGSGGAIGGAEDSCIVLKLYGPTSGGGVVVVNVRKSDILRNHPARQ